jgi:hypothetical protein
VPPFGAGIYLDSYWEELDGWPGVGLNHSYREARAVRLRGAPALDPLPNTMLSPKT